MEALLKYIDRDYILEVEKNISILVKYSETSKLPFAIMQCIIQSINSKQQINISYHSFNQVSSNRTIESIGCFHSQKDWYMIAFCNLRQEYRSFKLDRITEYKLIDVPFTREHPTLAEYVKIFREGDEAQEVVIQLDESNMQLLDSYKVYYGWVKEEASKEHTTVYFRILNLDHFARWYLFLFFFLCIPMSCKAEITNNSIVFPFIFE